MPYPSPSSPHAPIEPTGFFTGIEFRPIVAGVIIDTIATFVLTAIYYAAFVAKDLAAQGEAAEKAYEQYFMSSDGLLVSLMLGSLGTLIGGFYAAYKAGKLEMKHGGLVGIGSILLGLALQAAISDENALPEWFMALSFAAAIPAGALGGFFAEIFKNVTRGGGASRADSPPGGSRPSN